MMLQDLELAQSAARATHTSTPLGAGAAAVYDRFVESGGAGTAFSGIIRYLRGQCGAVNARLRRLLQLSVQSNIHRGK